MTIQKNMKKYSMTILIRMLISLFVFSFLQGCATVYHGSHQDLRITTSSNKQVFDTSCTVNNEEGQWVASVDKNFKIHRDGTLLNIECKNSSQIGKASFKPKFETYFLMVDLLLDLCVVSCWVDGLNNSWYKYPGYVIVEMK